MTFLQAYLETMDELMGGKLLDKPIEESSGIPVCDVSRELINTQSGFADNSSRLDGSNHPLGDHSVEKRHQ